MRVIIRADGNREIAMGHIMRCLSIADGLRRAGAETMFVTAGAETEGLLLERGYRNHILGTPFREMEAELPVFHAFYQEYPADLILVDSYFATGEYMREIGGWTRTAYLDDMGSQALPVSALINYNIYAEELPYREGYRQAGIAFPEKCLLGCAYAPLRKEFTRGVRSRKQERVTDVLITTGGGDLANAAGSLCRRLAEEMSRGLHAGVRYHVVCGPFVSDADKEGLRRLSAQIPAFIIHENVTNMSQLMQSCDAAVSAAGSTMYELCSMQLPTVCFYFAENQRRMAEYFDEATDIKNAGNMMEKKEETLSALTGRLLCLEQDGALRERIRAQMGRLTDGCGAQRIAEELIK